MTQLKGIYVPELVDHGLVFQMETADILRVMEVASWVADKVEGVPKSRNSLNKSLIMTLPKRNLDLDPVVEDVVGAGLRNKVSC